MAEREKDTAEKAREWFTSKEGMESLRRSVERAMKNTEEFKKCRQISPEILRRPFTI
jgi:hypothetical protein